MVPTGSLYHVIVNGMAYPTDLPTLRQWIQEGRIQPDTLIGKGTMKPIAAREVPALREFFAVPPPPAYAPPPPPSYAPPTNPNVYAPASGGYTQPYAPPTNPYPTNTGYTQPSPSFPPPASHPPPTGGYTQPYAPPTNPYPSNTGYTQPSPSFPPPASHPPPTGGYTQPYAPPTNPYPSNTGYTQPAPSFPPPASHMPPQPPSAGQFQPQQPILRPASYAPPQPSAYGQPYARPATAPAYGTVAPYPSVNSFPTEAHKQDSRYIEAMKKIKAGWITGVVQGVLTFLIVSIVVVSGADFLGISAFMYIDVLVIFGLTFGIFFKSRTCAVLMVIYYIVSKVLMIAEMGAPKNIASLALPIAITIIYIQAVVGTFKYHELKAEAERGRF
jgi:serine/threonine-protein kinase